MENWRRRFIVAGGFIEALLFSGCLFGWASLVHVLQQEGVYSNLCESKIDAATNHASFPNKIIPNSSAITNYENASDGQHVSLSFISARNQSLYEQQIVFSPTQFSGVDVDTAKYWTTSTMHYSDPDSDQNIKPEPFSDNSETLVVTRCLEQDQRFSLIYTIAAVNYGLTAIIIGFSLDRFGLWATRVCAGTFTTAGFLCLAFTSKDVPYLLWPALILISLGTMQLRQSSFQFANAYPNQRAAIITAYSGGYSISTTLFLLIQYGHAAGIPYQTTILILSGISLLTLPFTFFMPRMKIEDHKDEVEQSSESSDHQRQMVLEKDKDTSMNPAQTQFDKCFVRVQISKDGKDAGDKSVDDEEESEEDSLMYSNRRNSGSPTTSVQITNLESMNGIPLKESLCTLSAILHTHWHFINFFLILFYSASFNAWAYKTTDDAEDVAFYNEIAGLCQLVAPLFIPLAGFMTDRLVQQASKYEDLVERRAAQLEAPAYTLAASTVFSIAMLTCKMFTTKEAIYVSLGLIAISRPLVVGCCTTYIRIRFHPEHFNRLFGIFTTVVSLLALVQYPLFVWMYSSPENFKRAHWLLMAFLISSLVSPGHILVRYLSRKYAKSQLKYSLASKN